MYIVPECLSQQQTSIGTRRNLFSSSYVSPQAFYPSNKTLTNKPSKLGKIYTRVSDLSMNKDISHWSEGTDLPLLHQVKKTRDVLKAPKYLLCCSPWPYDALMRM